MKAFVPKVFFSLKCDEAEEAIVYYDILKFT